MQSDYVLVCILLFNLYICSLRDRHFKIYFCSFHPISNLLIFYNCLPLSHYVHHHQNIIQVKIYGNLLQPQFANSFSNHCHLLWSVPTNDVVCFCFSGCLCMFLVAACRCCNKTVSYLKVLKVVQQLILVCVCYFVGFTNFEIRLLI